MSKYLPVLRRRKVTKERVYEIVYYKPSICEIPDCRSPGACAKTLASAHGHSLVCRQAGFDDGAQASLNPDICDLPK
jgi:hypothetical protein